jgi:hypothetical protein
VKNSRDLAIMVQDVVPSRGVVVVVITIIIMKPMVPSKRRE